MIDWAVWRMVGLVALFVLAFAPSLSVAQEVRPIHFTATEAVRGESVYRAECASCHGNALQGANGPRLIDDGFDRFRERSARYLYNQMATAMPWGDPGSLPVADYLALVAFIAVQNGYPAGPVPLPGDPDALAFLRFGD